MSLPDLRFAADGAAYTYAAFVQWYGVHARRMWEGAAATEHSHSRTPQSSDVRPERRIAADGTHAGQLWEGAAATEHSESSFIGTDALPALEPQAATTRRCSTQADFVQMPRDATEHSPMEDAYSRWVALQISMATDERWQENTTEPQASSAACIETCTAVRIDCVGDQPRDATEQSPWEKALPAHAGNTFFVPQDAHEHALVLMPASSTASPQATGPLLQCVDCEHPLCGTEDLAFFWRLAMLQSMHRFMSCG